ncbi:MAG: hypothetical protein A2018_02335 [Alphaproteobacteria bacterium GWF2_58_20]|nr:MAG: hypothetical protein A2018_02335 [Alphaproteobacteria bacterium GWF2_58_20]
MPTRTPPHPEKVIGVEAEKWSERPPIRRVRLPGQFFLSRPVHGAPPKDVAEKRLAVSLPSGSATLDDLLIMLDQQGVSVSYNWESSEEADTIASRKLPFRRFDGTLAALMSKLENSMNLATWWEGNSLYIASKQRYSIAVPQKDDIISTISTEMTNLGASDIITSVYAGQILYSATPSLNKRVITPFLKRVSLNLSEITLQVAIITVSMTEEQQRGFDWDKFGVNIDTSNVLPADTTTNAAASASSLTGVYARTGYPILGTETAITINAAIKYLSTLGRTEAEQNVELRTLAGQEVSITDGGKTVYNSGYDIVTTDNVSREVAQPAEISTGMTLNITPNFDAESGLVTCEIVLDKTSLEELRSFGSGVSTVEYPITNTNNLKDIVRMRAGETVIIGGVVTSAYIDNRTAPVSMWGISSSTTRDTRKVLFIIMRPSVTVFELDGNQVGQGVMDAHTRPVSPTSDNDMFLPVTRLISNRETEAKSKAEEAEKALDKAISTIDDVPMPPPAKKPEPMPAPAKTFAPSTEGGLFDEMLGRIKSDTDTP